MRILLVAPVEMTGLGVVAGYCRGALETLGHEVEAFDFRADPYPRGRLVSRLCRALPGGRARADAEVNAGLLRRVEEFKPAVMLVLLGENIAAATIRAVRGRGVIAVNWLLDTLLLPYRRDFITRVGPAYDFIFTVDSPEIFPAIGMERGRVYPLPAGCDPGIHCPRASVSADSRSSGSGLAFVGGMTPEREKVLERLRRFDLAVWGRWERQSPLLKGHYRKKDVYREEAAGIYRSARIVIDIHGLFFVKPPVYNVTPRVFEVPACGGFLLTNRCCQLDTLYPGGGEIAVYSDIGELEEKIGYYLAHDTEREAMARKAGERARREHTYAARLRQMLETVKGA